MQLLRFGIIVAFVVFTSCSDGIVSECPIEDTNVKVNSTFSSIQSEVLSKNCATIGCHSGPNPTAGLNLSQGVSYNNIVNKTAPFGGLVYIKPGNPDESYLLQRISSESPGSVMPPSGRLSQSVIDSVKLWIESGALNN